MGDSWDDEDFVLPTVSGTKQVATAFDNEEDEADKDLASAVKAAGPTPAMLEVAARKAKVEEAALAEKLKFALLEVLASHKNFNRLRYE